MSAGLLSVFPALCSSVTSQRFPNKFASRYDVFTYQLHSDRMRQAHVLEASEARLRICADISHILRFLRFFLQLEHLHLPSSRPRVPLRSRRPQPKVAGPSIALRLTRRTRLLLRRKLLMESNCLEPTAVFAMAQTPEVARQGRIWSAHKLSWTINMASSSLPSCGTAFPTKACPSSI